MEISSPGLAVKFAERTVPRGGVRCKMALTEVTTMIGEVPSWRSIIANAAIRRDDTAADGETRS